MDEKIGFIRLDSTPGRGDDGGYFQNGYAHVPFPQSGVTMVSPASHQYASPMRFSNTPQLSWPGTNDGPVTQPGKGAALQRSRTNSDWSIYFAVFIAISIFCVLKAMDNSNIARLYKGINYQGKVCGGERGLSKLRYLYYPLDPEQPMELLKEGPQCVKNCPTEIDVKGGHTISVGVSDVSSNLDKSAVITEFNMHSPVYATEPASGSYCLPKDPKLHKQVLHLIGKSTPPLRKAVGSVVLSWPLIFSYVFLVFILSIVFLLASKAAPTYFFGFLSFYSVFIISFCGLSAIYGGSASLLDNYRRSILAEDHLAAITFGCVLVIAAIFVAVSLTIIRGGISVSVRMVKCVTEVIFDMPSTLITPLITGAVSFFWCIIWMAGYMHIASSAVVDHTAHSLALNTNGGIAFLPLHRRLLWEPRAALFAAFWWVTLFWVLEVVLAFNHFVTAYTGIVWYFSPWLPDAYMKRQGIATSLLAYSGTRDTKWVPSITGMKIAVNYHFGSLAFGAVIMPFTRPIRWLFGWASSKSKVHDYYSPLLEQIRYTLGNFITPITEVVNRFTTAGYVEMAVSSAPLIHSMDISASRLINSYSPAAALHGLLQPLCTLGTAAISMTVGALTYSVLRHADAYSTVSSSRFVDAPFFVAAVATVASAYVAAQYTSVVHMIADTMTYSFLVEANKPPVIDENPMTKLHAPQSLKDFLMNLQEQRQYNQYVL